MATIPNKPSIVIAGWNPDRVDRLFTRLYSDPSPVTIEGRKDLFKEIRALITGENDTYTDSGMAYERQWGYGKQAASAGKSITPPTQGPGAQPGTQPVVSVSPATTTGTKK